MYPLPPPPFLRKIEKGLEGEAPPRGRRTVGRVGRTIRIRCCGSHLTLLVRCLRTCSKSSYTFFPFLMGSLVWSLQLQFSWSTVTNFLTLRIPTIICLYSADDIFCYLLFYALKTFHEVISLPRCQYNALQWKQKSGAALTLQTLLHSAPLPVVPTCPWLSVPPPRGN